MDAGAGAYAGEECDSLVPSDITGPDEHDIARSGRGTLPLQRLFEFRNGNLVTRDGRGRGAVLCFVPAQPVDEDAAADDAATFAPI